MISTSIDRMDHETGSIIAIPDDVVRTVESADQVLRTQLESIHHLNVEASWCAFRHDPKSGWLVSLHIFTREFSYGREVAIQELRVPGRSKEFVRGVISEYGDACFKEAGEMIQRVRSDLKQMLAASGA